MKKRITGVVALLAGAFVAHSQGTVFFGNYASLDTYIYASLMLGGPKLGGSSDGTTGIPVLDVGNGNDWTVALYGNAGFNDPMSSLVPLKTAGGQNVTATLADGLGDKVPGTWFSLATALVPGTTFAGQSATVQLYAWYNDGGVITSYAAAESAGVPIGFSSMANTITGGPNPSGPPSTATPLPTFPVYNLGPISISSAPEPSTMALGLLGATAFLQRLRRRP